MHIREPTRITVNGATILDQIITNVPLLMKNTEVLDLISNCDHCPVGASIVLRNKYNKPKSFQRHVWVYKQTDIEEFKAQLQNADWDQCFEQDNVDRICEDWTSTF